MGGISGEFSSIPVTRRRYPDNEQRIATHSLRRKMARSQAERDPAYHRKAETIPAAGGVFYRSRFTGPPKSLPRLETNAKFLPEGGGPCLLIPYPIPPPFP